MATTTVPVGIWFIVITVLSSPAGNFPISAVLPYSFGATSNFCVSGERKMKVEPLCAKPEPLYPDGIDSPTAI